MKKILLLVFIMAMILGASCCGSTQLVEEEDIVEKELETRMSVEDVDGIVVLSSSKGEEYVWSSNDSQKCSTSTVYLDVIDPDTGEYENFKTFSSEETHSCTIELTGINNIDSFKENFNEDYTKLTASLTLEDGSEHVGYIDEEGEFTDISEQVLDVGEFDALPKHSSPLFGPNNYFYFMDNTNSSTIIERVPLDNLSPSSIEIMDEDVDWPGAGINLYPDGTIEDTSMPLSYFDANKNYPVYSTRFHDWVDEKTVVTTDEGNIYKVILSGKSGVFDYKESSNALVDYVNGRENYDPVVSNDKTEVAFLSILTTENEPKTKLFVVPIDGGKPVKIETSFNFDDTANKKHLVAWGLNK